jgi:predicted transposase YbfD/YdcC
LLDACRSVCARKANQSCKTIDGKRHNRAEQRLAKVFHLSEAEKESLGPDWKDLIASIVCVHRQTLRKDTKSGSYDLSTERAFYACHLSLSAKEAAKAIRNHWGIENRQHYVRDVSFQEDASRIRKKPTHFARLRSFALNIFRANSVKNIKAELHRNAMNLDRLLGYKLA